MIFFYKNIKALGKLFFSTCLFVFNISFSQQNLVKNPSLEDTLDIRPFKLKYNPLGNNFLNCAYWYNSDCIIYNNNCSHNYIKKKSKKIESYHKNAHAEIAISEFEKNKWYLNGFLSGTLKHKLKKDSLYQISYHFKPSKKVAYSFTKPNCYLDSTYIIDPFKSYNPIKNITYKLKENNWLQATTTYKANGNEKYITIGYFKGDIATYTKNKKHRKKVKKGYTFVDLVEVIPLYKEEQIIIKPKDSIVTSKKDELALFFKHDTFILSQQNKEKINYAITNNLSIIKKIIIHGYASKVGSNDYNLKLANQRTLAVKKHLLSKRIDVTIETNPFGTMHNLTGNLDEQRKVLIIFE